MEVEQQPSPWPCVAMLVGLLVFCLTVPRFWRNDNTPDDLADTTTGELSVEFSTPSNVAGLRGASERNRPFTFSSLGSAWPNTLLPNSDLLHLWAPPTIEELVAEHAGTTGLSANHGYGANSSVDWPTFATRVNSASDTLWTRSNDVSLVTADPAVLAALEGVGQAIAPYWPAETLPRLVARTVDLYRSWLESQSPTGARVARFPAATAPLPGRSTMRLVGPNDRLAMAPWGSDPPSIADSFSTSQPDDFATDCWCVPEVLLQQLERLTQHPASADWAQRTIVQLHALMKRDAFDGDDTQTILANLSESALEAVRMADETGEDRLRVELLRTHWGLARRLDRWAVMHDMRVASRTQNRVASRGSLSKLFDGTPATSNPATADDRVLANDLESYEQSRDPQLGRQLVQEQRALESSPDSLDRALADAVEQHYRNANVRVAITAAMLNRLVGEERSEVKPISERIAGAQIRGSAHMRSESRVRLEPATGHWKLDVEADGVVESNTLADGGPARLRSRGETDFTARKSIVVDANGVSLQPTDVDATSHNRLMGVTTDYDWVPLVGSYTRDRALQQYRAKQHRAKAAAESRIAQQAGKHMDHQTLTAVEEIREQFRARFTEKLSEHGIELTPVELTSTEERIVARLRVAGNHQLGSHTPRPRALSDSLASFQVHETALTNAAVSLALDGQRFTAPELQKALREKFPKQAMKNPPIARPDTVFHFAAADAVQFRIEDGRLEITIALASLEREGRSMRDVVVHAYYVPVVNGLNAELVRDGSLGIEGRLSSADRARLHNIFNSVLPPERRLPLLPVPDSADPRLEGLMITQLVLEDGWIGLAIGPTSTDRVAERSRSLR